MSLPEMWHNFREVLLMHWCGVVGHCCEELVEGELSLLLEEFLLQGREAF